MQFLKHFHFSLILLLPLIMSCAPLKLGTNGLKENEVAKLFSFPHKYANGEGTVSGINHQKLHHFDIGPPCYYGCKSFLELLWYSKKEIWIKPGTYKIRCLASYIVSKIVSTKNGIRTVPEQKFSWPVSITTTLEAGKGYYCHTSWKDHTKKPQIVIKEVTDLKKR